MTIVELLESLLERAREGTLTGIAVAACHDDLSTASAWAMEAATLAELLGSVAIMNSRLLGEAVSSGVAFPGE
jgi:hypothetical protein